MTWPLYPDTGEVLRAWLTDPAQAWAGTVADRVGLTLTGPDPAIRYAQVGAGAYGAGAVWTRFQVECWGSGDGSADDGTANLMARRVASAAPDLHGMIGGVQVSGAAADPPYPSPDPITSRPRWITELVLTAAP